MIEIRHRETGEVLERIRADLSHAVLSGSNMRHTILDGTNFDGTEPVTINLEFANISKAINADVPPIRINLR